MEYTTIFILDNSKGQLIVERPRDFVGSILKGMDGHYHKLNQKDLLLGATKIGEVQPLKNTGEDSVYVYLKGELIEVNPDSPTFDNLLVDKDKLISVISVLQDIYSKLPTTESGVDKVIGGLVDSENTIEDSAADEEINDEVENFAVIEVEEINDEVDEDSLEDVLDEPSDVSELVDEKLPEEPVKAEPKKRVTKKTSTTKTTKKTTPAKSRTTKTTKKDEKN